MTPLIASTTSPETAASFGEDNPTGRPAQPAELAPPTLDQLEAGVCVDPARVFVTGVSNGGGPTARLACDLSDRLAGVASIAGAYQAPAPCNPKRPLPVLEIHGTADQVFPYGARPSEYKASVRRWLGTAAPRRLPRERRPAEARARRDRDRLAPLHRRDARGARAPRSPGPRLAPPPGDPLQPAPYAATWRAWQFFRSLPPRPPVQTG